MSRASHPLRLWARTLHPFASSTRCANRPYGQALSALTVKQNARSFHDSRSCLLQLGNPLHQESKTPIDDAGGGNDAGSVSQFSDLARTGQVDQVLVDTVTKRMRIDTMTDVQRLTINEALKGVDVLAQAKTGTGKTLAFLLPILQKIINSDPALKKLNTRRSSRRQERLQDIRAIIISPTRELAEQIATETQKLVQNTGLVVQNAVGGTQKSMHLRKMGEQGCHVLVGTPGRLNDLFSDPSTGIKAPKLSALVLDEADRLMDQGFWPEIQQFQSMLPDRDATDRQTLLYSATVPEQVVKLARTTMKKNLHFVQTVSNDETPTHERVKQTRVSVPGFENFYPVLLEIIQRAQARSAEAPDTRPFKAIVYFPSTAEAKAAAAVFSTMRRDAQTPEEQRNIRIFDIHSRLSQSQRTRAAEMFRNSKTAILMSSDVTARGMDFPNVTHVIQMGLPQTREAYIHRLGRTARAGAEGEGWLIHPEFMSRELKGRLGKLQLSNDTTLEAAKADLTRVEAARNFDDAMDESLPPRAAALFSQVRRASSDLDFEQISALYMSNFGTSGWFPDKEMLIKALNRLMRIQFNLTEPPRINAKLAQQLGLNSTRGARIADPALRGNRSQSFDGARPSFSGGGARRAPGGSPRFSRREGISERSRPGRDNTSQGRNKRPY
ncbi:MAG: hypothetical protein M1831_001908 [Alyxoria varia]|nr:MAG: hypothetical protein M1831_001908 [Alyxoria varia]